ncbi:MAG: hypothetical protein K8R02_01500 [Anaerohalosphaeraceae bacterium]|nr:hypothetical protein [Anaerohalosphaeraceae bacterium]
MKNYIKNLNPRDARAMKLGIIGAIAILCFVFLSNWAEHWGQVKKDIAVKQELLDSLNVSEAKRIGLMSIVPVFEMPVVRQEQEFLFRDNFKKQLDKAGIKAEPLQILSAGKSNYKGGYRKVFLKCKASKCKFEQIADLLGGLKENPYLAGLEEFKIKGNTKQPDQFEFLLTVSTFVK